MTTEKPIKAANIWSGFWARLGAWIVDTIVLGLVCYAIGWAGISFTASWGSNGRLVGLVLGLFYFGIMSSGQGGGQTLGMRLCRLKVTQTDGRPVGHIAAFGRALFLVGPVLLNGWYLPTTDPTLAIVFGIVAITAVFGILLAQVYLLLFNLPTRRLVHDLLFGTIVVKSDALSVQSPPVRTHGVVATGLVLVGLFLAVAGPAALRAVMPSVSTTSPMQQVANAVRAVPGVTEAGVADNTMTVMSGAGTETTRTLIVNARVEAWPKDARPLLARIGAATVKVYRFAPGQRLQVKIVYGFDLGFATYNTFYTSTYSTDCTTADVRCLPQ